MKEGFLPFFDYWGPVPKPQIPYFLWRKERSKETSTPTKPPPILGGLICFGGKPPSAKILVRFTEPVPLRGESWFFTSWLSPPLEKGFTEVEGCRASVLRPYIIVLLVAALGKSGKAERTYNLYTIENTPGVQGARSPWIKKCSNRFSYGWVGE